MLSYKRKISSCYQIKRRVPFRQVNKKYNMPTIVLHYFLKSSIKAFTLAELLIALIILGVIATFTIPKILTAQEDQKKTAVFKECIDTIQQSYYTGWLEGVLRENSVAPSTYVLPRVNAIKICPTNSGTENCWTQDASLDAFQLGSPGFILASGCTVAGISTNTVATGDDYIIVDWNGPQAPNVEGDDQMVLITCFKATGTCAGGVKAGSFRGKAGASRTLYESLYSN
ncbi:MAG: type II secretion system protein [Vampirovibrionales bacterium]|nr:type II secretion system protein [Vampirovibrionales bacterium]